MRPVATTRQESTLPQDEISYNPTGASTIGGLASIYSFVNNRFTENGVDGGPFASIAFE